MAEFKALERLEGPADYRRFDVLLSWIVWSLAMWDKGKRPEFGEFVFRWCEMTEEEKQEQLKRNIIGVFTGLKAQADG